MKCHLQSPNSHSSTADEWDGKHLLGETGSPNVKLPPSLKLRGHGSSQPSLAWFPTERPEPLQNVVETSKMQRDWAGPPVEV